PSFGTPESGIGVLCTAQIARHVGLPWRGGGALNASQTVDAQAAYESLMTFLPTFLAGANFVMRLAGWLEGGLVSCYEKFIVDVELLRELRHERWTKKGARDTTARAGEIWRATLESYEQPPLDEVVNAELEEFVVRRRAELGD
ncbi:MAG TPA: trimethylamine methyltransferase family protein, partial [Solirubrobacteraceae bacterium]